MNKHIKLINLLTAFLLSTNASASEIINAKITKLMVDRNHGAIVFIQTDGVSDRTPGAGCHTNSTWDYVSDLTDTAGQEIYSTLRSKSQPGNIIIARQRPISLRSSQ